ncbi:MAG: cell envelope biogenesis protein OmpA [Saonia sp.]
MKNFTKYKVAFGCIIMILFCSGLTAQQFGSTTSNNPKVRDANKRIDDYLKLLKLGYTEREIFEDLGNANFLIENYDTASFWYQKLIDLSDDHTVSAGYHERYQYALKQSRTSGASVASNEKDWFASIKADYRLKKNKPLVGKYGAIDFNANNDAQALNDLAAYELPEEANLESVKAEKYTYKPPVTVTADGNIAYFSKPVYLKPLQGIFSKKQLVHKIFRAEKISGQWKNIKEVAVCPKYSSAIHPTVSDDGKRLFFASDMPGTFGKYDIYVASLERDGTFGVAKNLGQKVNTDKNDLYPNIVGGTSLVFASDGHKGHGGLDIFMAQVAHKKVSRSINLGSPINSIEDDFSILLGTQKGTGYVMSNRGKGKDAVGQVAFSYAEMGKKPIVETEEYRLVEILNSDLKTDYSTTIYEDQ